MLNIIRTAMVLCSSVFALGSLSLAADEALAPKFTVQAKGKTPLYQFYGSYLQDLSASAYDQGVVLLGFDGGRNAQFPELRITDEASLPKPAKLLKRQLVQKDIEAATAADGKFYVIASLSQEDEDTQDYRVFVELTLDDRKEVASERYVYFRKKLLKILQRHFDDDLWFARIATTFGKSGGLNVEGLSVTDVPGQLMVGLRSPLYDKNFGDKVFGKNISLDRGKAILVNVTDPFSKRMKSDVITLDLDGQGVRGMEYIPALKGYVIIGGSVEKGNNFSLWFYRPAPYLLEKISLQDFDHLCRPESILSIPEQSIFYILSEESGSACNDVKFSFLKVSYDN
ncbi:hypothetical protein TDB9533_01100 [Thalassocella blandensis]|nr:hypothetical protein TDB9533_01100 [Thalassocella blandensis]